MGRALVHTITLPKLGAADESFVARVRRGDLDAIGQAFDLHHSAVCSFAKRLVGDDPSAEDLVQEVFLCLPRLVHKLDEEASLRSFLLGIAANRARHHLRAARRRRHFSERLEREPPERLETPEHLSERRGLAAALGRALETLPFDQRVTFVLREIEGYTAAEVAGTLGIPEATVRTRVFHAKKRLRAWLAERGMP